MKTIKRIIALSLLVVLLGSTAAFTASIYMPESVWRCRQCGKVADGDLEKMTAGLCSGGHSFHDWEELDMKNAQKHWECRRCGKVAESDLEKMTAGSCSHFIHDWVWVVSDHSTYSKKLKETEAEKMKEQLIIGHGLGLW